MCFRSKLFSVAVQVAAIIILPLVDRSPCVDERVESRSPASTPSKSHYSCLSGWHVEAATSLQLSNAFAALQRFAFNEVTIYSRTIASSPFRVIFSRKKSSLAFSDGARVCKHSIQFDKVNVSVTTGVVLAKMNDSINRATSVWSRRREHSNRSFCTLINPKLQWTLSFVC